MVLAGSAVMVAYSAAIAWRLHMLLNSEALDSLGLLGSLGLASLHAVRAMALDHSIVLSLALHVLILFSAFLVMLVGIALMPRGTAGVIVPGEHNLPAPRKGDQ